MPGLRTERAANEIDLGVLTVHAGRVEEIVVCCVAVVFGRLEND
jgi:hypothetical protein